MSTADFPSSSARRYLRELDDALSGAPTALRDEIVTDLAGELRGLDEGAATARIAELGDPRLIAADATSEAAASVTPGSPADRPAPSRTYATVTGIVLTAGWYLTAIVGWVAGLVMIGIGGEWTTAVRRRAILISIAGALVATAALLVFRTTDFGLVGLGVFLVLPLIVNIYVASYLRAHWAER